MKIKILKNVTANIDGRSVPLKVGDIQDVSGDAADNLIRGGYAAKYGGNKPAVKVQSKPKALSNKSFKGE